MAREIKFRAWVESSVDSETGMYYPMVLQLLGGGSVDKLWTNDYKFTSDTCSFILMQYTCLRDKNGVEIYEGDIVRSKGGETYQVVFENGGFRTSGVVIHPKYFKTDEVIGNIYENPDLLKGEPNE